MTRITWSGFILGCFAMAAVSIAGDIINDTPADNVVERAVSSPALTDDCESVIGHGVTYGPLAARRLIVVWDCPSGLVVELTEYDPPEQPLDSRGPEIGTAILPADVVSWLQDEVCEPCDD